MSSRVAIPPSTSAAQAALAASSNNLNSSSQQHYSSYNTNNTSQQLLLQQLQLQQQLAVGSINSSGGSSSSSSQIVGLHYKIGKKVGEGSFGVIFEGTNMINGVPVAIKFEPRKTEAPQLRDEYRTYKHLSGSPGIPNLYYFGQEGLHNILVIDLLGPSLEDLFDWCGRRFTIKTVVQVLVQMISLIEEVHAHDLIYRDIKPDNFLIGRPGLADEHKVHLIDFGMLKQYRDPRTKQHIPYREKKSLSGTLRYMSVNTHLGREQSRRDDLELLGHVFFYFLRGQLPWQGLKLPTNKQKYEKIGEKKRTTPVLDLCSGLPKQFAIYLETVRGLLFDLEPDYNYLRNLLLSLLEDLGEKADGNYDWQRLNGGRGWDALINKKPNLHGYGHPNPPGERDRRHHHHSANLGGLQLQQLQQLQRRNHQSKQNLSLQQQQQQQQQQQYANSKHNNRPLPQVPLLQQNANLTSQADYPQYRTQLDPVLDNNANNVLLNNTQNGAQNKQNTDQDSSADKKVCFCF